MSSLNCVFCKIINKEIPSSPILETKHTLVIKDLHPRAPIHYLLLPKIHVEHMGFITVAENDYIVDLGLSVAMLSKSLVQNTGFNIVVNNGKTAGQSVFHLHWHFLAGKALAEEGGLSLL